MRKLELLMAAAVLATAVGFAGTAKATPNYTIEGAPLSTENYWKTSSFVGTSIGAAYVPTLSEFDGILPDGYVSDASVISSGREIFQGSNDSNTRFLYSTHIISDVDQTLEIVILGDDGHSLYVDGILVDGTLSGLPADGNSGLLNGGPGGGGGFGVAVVFDLDLVANEAVKLDLVGANAGGPWNFQIGVDQQVITAGFDFIAPTSALTSVAGIRMDAEGFAPAIQLVDIDIKPGSDPNSINLCGAGVIPVAIFGSDDFLVSDIVISTLRLGDGTPDSGSEVKMVGKSGKELCSTEDVDFDGFDDLVCKFVTVDLNLAGGDIDATVLGSTTSEDFVGTDSVNIVKDECG